jgi:hypothetical protein
MFGSFRLDICDEVWFLWANALFVYRNCFLNEFYAWLDNWLTTEIVCSSNWNALYATALQSIQDYLCLSLCCHLWVSVRVNAFTTSSPSNNIYRLSWASAAWYRGNASKKRNQWYIAVSILEATDRMNINPLQLLRFSTIFVSSKEKDDFRVTTVSLL